MYTGRFAPTPSGPLHFGSIVAALGSFLDARKNSGMWLLRMDDLDTPRVQPGACDDIVRTLEKLGLYWDGEILYQSSRIDAYREALRQLESDSMVYPCICTRSMVRGKAYPGTCRNRDIDRGRRHSIRLKVNDSSTTLDDGVYGHIGYNLDQEVGDFVLLRTDNIFSYHLSSVIDDHWLEVTHIIRGADLIESTICQIYLQSLMGISRAKYSHLPVAVSVDGRKISKTNKARNVLLDGTPEKVLLDALDFLGQAPGKHLYEGTVEEIIQWAVDNWDISRVPVEKEIRINPKLTGDD